MVNVVSPSEANKNAEAANHIVGIDAEVHELDWCSFDHADLVRLLQNVDCIVGADIFFEPALFEGRVFLLFVQGRLVIRLFQCIIFFLLYEPLYYLIKRYLKFSTDLACLISTCFELRKNLEVYLIATMRNTETWEKFLTSCKNNELSLKKISSSNTLEPVFNFDRTIPIEIFEVKKF